jgi:hypothetical protein
MMKMSSTPSECPIKPGAQGNHGARILPAALAEPPTPTFKTARATANASRPIEGSSIGMTMKGKVTMVNRKLYTLVISKIILLSDFPADSIMIRYIYQKGWKELEDVISIGVDEIKEFFTVCKTDSSKQNQCKSIFACLRHFYCISCGKDDICLPH